MPFPIAALLLSALTLPSAPRMQDEVAVEVDLSLLITLEYEEGKDLPEEIKRYDGKLILIRGFMDPSQFTPDRLAAFRLVSDACGCTGRPLVHHFVDVALEGIDSEFDTGMVELEGLFSVGEVRDEEGFVTSLYRLRCDTVR